MSDRHPEILLPPDEANRQLGKTTRRSLIVGGIAAAGAVGFYRWVTRSAQDNGAPWPERRVLDVNARLAQAYLNDHHLVESFRPDQVGGVKPNGDVGLNQPMPDPANWRVQLTTEEGKQPMNISLAAIKTLPKTEMITRFCCIEGWSGVAHWGGTRFSDFTKRFFPAQLKLPRYVYMSTPGGDYYVGLDIKSAMHPQTLLAWEQNGKPLEGIRGAPLRLAIPVKYGIKNIKRIGVITYTDTKPDDYWAEEGYDWFAGL